MENVTGYQKKQNGAKFSRARNCAECRRLKIKCDRKLPCTNCVKRGMSSNCPDGQLLPKEQRAIVLTTDDLYSKITELTERIKELEDALASLQAQHSSEPHPLLSKSEEPPLTSFGSLMIKEDGNARFFGATSSVEWIMTMQDGPEGKPTTPEHIEPFTLFSVEEDSMVKSASILFPLPIDGIDRSAMMERAIVELPQKDTAIAIVDCYYHRAAWEMSPILRKRFIIDHFVPCFDHSSQQKATLQDFALVYAILALGMLYNDEFPNHRQLSFKYNSLSQACLSAGDFIKNTSLSVVDALLVCAVYHFSAEDPTDPHKAWVLLGVALKLATGMGLHREPSVWGLSADECKRRRRTMWELVSCDLWASLVSGRPPTMPRHHFDVKIPVDEADGSDFNPNFSRGKHHFSENCLWQVLDLGLASSNKATYAAVMKVDTKIRNWTLPKVLQTAMMEPLGEQRTIHNFRKTTELIFREITLLCLHRAYFASALLEPPYDPLGSVYSRSVLAAYGSACAIIARIKNLYSLEPVLTARFSFFWIHSFSAAATLASLAIRAPDCRLAPTALLEFDGAVELFKRGQASYRAGRGLPTLLRLQTSAHASFDSYRAGTWTQPTMTDSQLQRGLGGSANVQHVRTQRRESPSVTPVPLPVPEVSATMDVMGSLAMVEPSLEEYLRSYGVQPVASSSQDEDERRQSKSNDLEFAEMGMNIPSSDTFLHGVLTGQWNAPSSNGPQYQAHSSFPDGSTQSSLFDQLQYTQDYRYDQDTASGPRLNHDLHQPFPDLLSGSITSSFNVGSNAVTGFEHNSSQPADSTVEDNLQANFVWENFLKELGVQGNSV